MLTLYFSGALVLYDPNDPHADLYDVDDESTVITLGDWYQVNMLHSVTYLILTTGFAT